jgi:hypothetical protein
VSESAEAGEIILNLAKELAALGFTNEQIATATIGGKPLSEVAPETKQHRYGKFRSKWEAQYSWELDAQKAASLIDGWLYEAITLVLTEPTIVGGKTIQAVTYKPDFMVWVGSTITFVEIKGFKREASIARYKMAKDKFRMFEFRMLTLEGGQWKQIM